MYVSRFMDMFHRLVWKPGWIEESGSTGGDWLRKRKKDTRACVVPDCIMLFLSSRNKWKFTIIKLLDTFLSMVPDCLCLLGYSYIIWIEMGPYCLDRKPQVI